MNAALGNKTLFAALAALILTGASFAARAEDMAGMEMEKGTTAQASMDKKPAKEPAADASGAKSKKGTQKLEMAVTDKGFEPNAIEVKKGQPVELVFTRKTDQTCIKDVVLDTGGAKVEKSLPLNKPVVIKTKFTKAGTYACKMNMFSGTVKVE